MSLIITIAMKRIVVVRSSTQPGVVPLMFIVIFMGMCKYCGVVVGIRYLDYVCFVYESCLDRTFFFCCFGFVKRGGRKKNDIYMMYSV